MLPNVATYHFPVTPTTGPVLLLCGVCGVIAGLFSVVYVRLMTIVERNKPGSRLSIAAPIVALTILGVVATRFPELLGNGRDISQLLFLGESTLSLAAVLLVLKPAAILLCVGAGVPGG